jgi:ribosome-associated protein
MTNHSIFKELNHVAQAIYDKKGFNILVIDVREICTMTDYFIIAEGTVDRHVKAIAQVIMQQTSQLKFHPLHVEGEREGDWIVLDYSDFIIHLFTPDMREKYALEDLWRKGKIVDIKIDTSTAEVSKQQGVFLNS